MNLIKKISKSDWLIISTIVFGVLVIVTDAYDLEILKSLSANDGEVI